MRLDRRLTPEAIEAALRQEVAAAFGPARSVRLNERLGLLAGWLARIAAEPLALEDTAPDQSGIDLSSDRPHPTGERGDEDGGGR